MSSSNFIPSDFNEEGTTGKYTKLNLGRNKLRILSSPIAGVELWIEDGGKRKPVRFRKAENIPASLYDEAIEYADGKKHKQFWAMVVWNYDLNLIQVWEVTQKTIREQLTSYSEDSDFGSPLNYDIVVERKGEKKDTEYIVKALSSTALGSEITEAKKAHPVNLDALFENGDPFQIIAGDIVDEDIDIDELPESLGGS